MVALSGMSALAGERVNGLGPVQKEKQGGASAGSLAWLMLATRRQRENIFRHVLDSAGRQPFAKITTATIKAGRDRRVSTPSQARHFLDSLRGLFRWAVEAQIAKVDPTIGVADPARTKSDGFAVWTQDDIAAYEKHWPIGTKERVGLTF